MICRIASLLLLLASVTLVGCARPYTEPPVDENHPAYSGATAAPLPPSSNVLSLAATRPASDADHTQSGGHMQHGVLSTGNSSTTQTTDTAMYVCPMHPDVVSDQPGRCPKCNMKLVRRSAKGNQP